MVLNLKYFGKLPEILVVGYPLKGVYSLKEFDNITDLFSDNIRYIPIGLIPGYYFLHMYIQSYILECR